MDREEYEVFVNKFSHLSVKVGEIFNYSFKDSCSGGSCSIDHIEFTKDTVSISYTYGFGGSYYPESKDFPSRLLYVDNWRAEYDMWALEKRRELSERESELKRKQELDIKERRRQEYLKLKKEFEGKH